VAVQLGDGDVVAAGADGVARRPVPPDGRNVGGRTTSMCLVDAAESFRITALDHAGRPPALVLVATDGYGNAFADPRWPEQVSRDLLALDRRHGRRAIAEALPRWVRESADVGGDDTTVAVAFRDRREPVGDPYGAAAAAVPMPASTPTGPHAVPVGPAPSPRPARPSAAAPHRRQRSATAALVLGALAVGGAGGALVRGGPTDDVPAASAVTHRNPDDALGGTSTAGPDTTLASNAT
jgi:hypothetical protein